MIIVGDSFAELAKLESRSVQACITSPPYWGLRDYGHEGQLGLEATPEQYVGNLRLIFEQVRRVLKDDGTLWLNLGDSYASSGGNSQSRLTAKQGTNRGALIGSIRNPPGLKVKDLVGIPWRVAFALQADGWYLRQDIIWHKPNPMPESVRDRCTKAHEYLFLLAKSERYLFNVDAIKEPSVRGWAGSKFHTGKTGEHQLGRAQKRSDLPGNKMPHKGLVDGHVGSEKHRTKVGLVDYATRMRANPEQMDLRQKRSVWTVTTKPFKGAHFATFPPDLIEPCVLAGSRPGDIVLDPFFGAGTTGLVAKKHGRNYIGIEINPEYAALAQARIEPSEVSA